MCAKKIIIIVFSMLCSASCTIAQRVVDTNCISQRFGSSLFDSAYNRITYGLTNADYAYRYPDTSGFPGYVMFELDPRGGVPHKSLILEISKLTLLAWQTKQIGPSLTVHSALLWAKYLKTDSTNGWALLVLSTDTTTQRWLASKRSDEPLIRYTEAPSLNDVIKFLNQLNGIEGRILNYDENLMYNWSTVVVTFLDGMICEKTWEAVIGEKPTKFFPG